MVTIETLMAQNESSKKETEVVTFDPTIISLDEQGELRLESDDFSTFSLSPNAQKTLLKDLGFNKAALTKALENGASANSLNIVLKELARTQRGGESPFAMVINKNKNVIYDAGTLKSSGFENQEILTKFAEKLDTNPELYIMSTSMITSDGKLILNIGHEDYNKIYLFGKNNGYDKDFFSMGVSIFNDNSSISNATNISSYIERLICLNGMRGQYLNYTTRVNNKDMMKSFLKKFTKGVKNSLFEEMQAELTLRLHESFNTNASINEVLTIYRLLIDAVDEDFSSKDTVIYNNKISQITEAFNLSALNDIYGENWEKQSQGWKETANSGIKHYDAVNLGTYFASHGDLDLTENTKIQLQFQLNKVAFPKRGLDLINVAPNVQIKDLLSESKKNGKFKLV